MIVRIERRGEEQHMPYAEQSSVNCETPSRASAGGLTPDSTIFIIVSFEGPDAYSQAGGLGVRISGLVSTLADLGYETHLFFIGDPAAPGEESTRDGRLVLHRWSQWISAN